MSSYTDRVVAAARAAEKAEAALRRAIAEAVEAGEPVAEVARLAGVTRQTVYRWIGPT